MVPSAHRASPQSQPARSATTATSSSDDHTIWASLCRLIDVSRQILAKAEQYTSRSSHTFPLSSWTKPYLIRQLHLGQKALGRYRHTVTTRCDRRDMLHGSDGLELPYRLTTWSTRRAWVTMIHSIINDLHAGLERSLHDMPDDQAHERIRAELAICHQEVIAHCDTLLTIIRASD